MSGKKTERIIIRCTKETRDLWKELLEKRGITGDDWFSTEIDNLAAYTPNVWVVDGQKYTAGI